MTTAEPRQRIDKWLWFARLAKSRTAAQAIVGSGAVRINRQKIDNASHAVRVGDTLTVALVSGVRVLRVVATGERRGPATEARLLFEDLTPVAPVAKGTFSPMPAISRGICAIANHDGLELQSVNCQPKSYLSVEWKSVVPQALHSQRESTPPPNMWPYGFPVDLWRN